MARAISEEELQLKRRARRRLIGAIVLVTAMVVALPMLLDGEPKPIGNDISVKIPPSDPSTFTSRIVPVAPPEDAKPAPSARMSTEMKSAPPTKGEAAEQTAAVKGAEAPPARAERPAPPPRVAAPPEVPAAPSQQKSVAEAPAAKPAAGASAEDAPFVVQVVALADAEKAKEVQAQIAAAGIKAYTEVVKTVKGDVTRVRAGPFTSRAAAEKARDHLQSLGLGGNVVAR